MIKSNAMMIDCDECNAEAGEPCRDYCISLEANKEHITRVCTYCGGYSEYLRALCNACMDAHNAGPTCEARPMSCHACNMIDMEAWDF